MRYLAVVLAVLLSLAIERLIPAFITFPALLLTVMAVSDWRQTRRLEPSRIALQVAGLAIVGLGIYAWGW